MRTSAFAVVVVALATTLAHAEDQWAPYEGFIGTYEGLAGTIELQPEGRALLTIRGTTTPTSWKPFPQTQTAEPMILVNMGPFGLIFARFRDGLEIRLREDATKPMLGKDGTDAAAYYKRVAAPPPPPQERAHTDAPQPPDPAWAGSEAFFGKWMGEKWLITVKPRGEASVIVTDDDGVHPVHAMYVPYGQTDKREPLMLLTVGDTEYSIARTTMNGIDILEMRNPKYTTQVLDGRSDIRFAKQDEPALPKERRVLKTRVLTADECRKGAACAERGACSLNGNVCRAGSPADCKQSKACKDDGKCSASEGECMATSAADCKRSKGCADEGRCILDPDDGCVTATSSVQERVKEEAEERQQAAEERRQAKARRAEWERKIESNLRLCDRFFPTVRRKRVELIRLIRVAALDGSPKGAAARRNLSLWSNEYPSPDCAQDGRLHCAAQQFHAFSEGPEAESARQAVEDLHALLMEMQDDDSTLPLRARLVQGVKTRCAE